MIQIIIPAAGKGSRFELDGYIDPKPMIKWDNKIMIEHVVSNFKNSESNITIIKRKNHLYQIDNINLIDIDYITNGPATTAKIALDTISEDNELIITNCDQIIKDWNQDMFLSHARKYDGVLGCFLSSSNKNSFVQINDNNLIVNVKEKEVISNIATNGLHYWKKAKYFIQSYNEMVINNDMTNNEFYIAPTYNYLIKDGFKIGLYMFNQHYPIGTPEDLKRYLDNENK